MKSEAKANDYLAQSVRDSMAEQERWLKVLAAPAKPTQRKVVKQGFFSRFFKVA